jgi:hypothetical protein
MAKDVGKSRFQMSLDVDVRYLEVRTIGAFDQLLGRLAAALDNLLGVTLEKNLADRFGVGIELGVGKVPWRVEGFGKREMLLGDDAPRNTLSLSVHDLSRKVAPCVVPIAASLL